MNCVAMFLLHFCEITCDCVRFVAWMTRLEIGGGTES